ncbi:MAG: hypothetical protein DRP42_00435 [Tenericutes bacterium]|nr:MAG: hypothetical protein DRP42_00435 [Mycoplasmatota bacterium]
MKKMNKKITLGVVTAFTASTMLGLGLGFALNKDQLNQVNIITAHNSYVLGEEEMSAIEYLADIISDKYERNFDDGGEEETPPGGDNPIDRDSSKGIASE